jgi:RimJ/RimL family protein N-acetyltransferase/SAM-dependent methyltransferase
MGDAVNVSPPVTVTLRPAGPDDCRQIWLWRNDEDTRRASFDSSPVSLESHQRWYQESLRNRNRKIYVVVAGDQPSGVVRLDLSGRQATVSINLAPEWRGRGIGPLALERLVELAFGPLGLDRLVASVKADNRASLAAFAKAGFVRSGRGATRTLVRSRHEGAESVRHFLLTGFKRGRARLTSILRGTPVWSPLRAAYRAASPLWPNALLRSALMPLRRRLYTADPRGYWQAEGHSYLSDESFLLGPASVTERQGRFLAAEIEGLGAENALEVGCGYGRLLKEIRQRLDVRLAGVDFSESQLRAARGYLGAIRVPLVLADATRGLPFRDGAFDVVYTQGSLMHVPPPLDRDYRRELARVSRRYIIHTEDASETEITFAHDDEAHYRKLGHRVVKKMPYPFNLPGQSMTFAVFERAPRSRR